MGEYAELALEQAIGWFPFDFETIPFDRETQWITKDGSIVQIADMTPSHIANCIRMLERKGKAVPQLMYHILEKDPF